MLGFPCGSAGKEPTCNVGDLGLIPGFGKIPWRQSTPVFLPENSHGQKNLVDSNSMGHKESDMTEHKLNCYLFCDYFFS